MESQVKSTRGREIFVYNGFMYVYDNVNFNNTIRFWRCRNRNVCKARIHTGGNDYTVIKTINEHCHDSEASKIEADVAVTNLKRKATECMEPTSTLINMCIAPLSEAAKATLQNSAALKKQVRRKRQEILDAPQNPENLTILEIPASYRMYTSSTGNEELFLQDDSGPSPDRILIFGRSRSLDILQNSEIWYVDGTFKIAPPLFSQVYVILAEYLDSVLPLVYILLPDKQSKTYDKMFSMLKNLRPDLNPSSVSCDFEQAAIKSIKIAFPNVKIFGCLFHLTKNIRKQLGELHLISQYNNISDFAVSVKMIVALAFVKLENLDAAVDALAEYLSEEFHNLLEWFEDNYIGRVNRNGRGRRHARFPPDIWNLYNRVLNSQDRTNNHAEAANRRLNVEMGVCHPSIWAFINCLKKVQSGHDYFYSQLTAGKSPPKKLKKFADLDKRILKIVQQYDSRDYISYLKGIAYNISLP